MHLLKNRSMRFYLVFFLVLTMALGGSAIAAFADSGTGATVAVSGGNLSQTAPTAVAATPVSLTGDDQTTSYALALTVNDPRGSGAGWHMTITSTLFDDGAGHQLASGASNILTTPAVACISGGGHCTSPSNSVSYPLAVPAASPAPAAVPLFNAAVNSGLGKFTITPTVTVSIPANTIAGTYSSTVSVAIATGP